MWRRCDFIKLSILHLILSFILARALCLFDFTSVFVWHEINWITNAFNGWAISVKLHHVHFINNIIESVRQCSHLWLTWMTVPEISSRKLPVYLQYVILKLYFVVEIMIRNANTNNKRIKVKIWAFSTFLFTVFVFFSAPQVVTLLMQWAMV